MDEAKQPTVITVGRGLGGKHDICQSITPPAAPAQASLILEVSWDLVTSFFSSWTMVMEQMVTRRVVTNETKRKIWEGRRRD